MNVPQNNDKTGYPSVEKPWLKYHRKNIPEPFIPQSLYDNLFNSNKDFKNHIAIHYFNTFISYGQLFESISEAEKAFWRLGVRKNDTVCICSVNTPEVIASLYGLNHLGAAVNLIDPRAPVESIRHFLKEGKSEYILCIDKVYEKIAEASKETFIRKIITVSPADSMKGFLKIAYKLKTRKVWTGNSICWKDFIQDADKITPEYALFEPCKTAVMAHTGGTTGNPKTVCLSSENLNAVAYCFKYGIIPIHRGEKYFNDLPPFIIFGLSVALHASLSIGLELIVYPKFNSKEFPKKFRKYRPNHFAALPGHIKYLIEDKKIEKMDLGFLMTAAVGGDSLNTQLETQANEFFKKHNCMNQVSKGFGMTELSAAAVISFGNANAVGSTGIPGILNNIKIVDTETHRELTYNQKGEIWISGPSVMLGYLEKLDETEEIITSDEMGVRWLHTGDLGYITEDGLVYIEGRLRRFYLSVVENQPVKIFPNVIEKALKEHSLVYDACAVGRLKEESTYYEIIVYVIKTPQCIIPEEQLKEELFELSKERIPLKMQPHEIRFISDFPLTTGGKVDFLTLEKKI